MKRFTTNVLVVGWGLQYVSIVVVVGHKANLKMRLAKNGVHYEAREQQQQRVRLGCRCLEAKKGGYQVKRGGQLLLECSSQG